ncbi:hypothetical protein [Paracoccus actinidiae]|uniref:hypothetical protein n=1 Tax=Paracoccus actinidiae TaxID=3064531 RepID=UPI0027D22DE0|nr:hypothetical protein [Paracoccus sp. M09]
MVTLSPTARLAVKLSGEMLSASAPPAKNPSAATLKKPSFRHIGILLKRMCYSITGKARFLSRVSKRTNRK